jgi:hypothetical protein
MKPDSASVEMNPNDYLEAQMVAGDGRLQAQID